MVSKPNDTELAEIVKREMDNHDENPEDIEVIKITETGGFRPGGCQEATFEDLTEIMGYTGCGGESFPNLYVYTTDRVYFKRIYDGSESIASVPRNPTNESPGAFAGG